MMKFYWLFLALGTFAWADDVNVTAPQLGTLVVTGELAEGQSDALEIHACSPDPKTVFRRGSCREVAGEHVVNSSIQLPEGAYVVWVGRSGAVDVRIRPNAITTLFLSKIVVSEGNGATSFRVFADITSADEWYKHLVYSFSAPPGDFDDYACGNPNYRKICSALYDSPNALNGVTMATDETANYYQLHIRKYGDERWWENTGRWWIGKWAWVGSFVSVLPGTYGISFYNDSTQTTEDRYGKVVK